MKKNERKGYKLETSDIIRIYEGNAIEFDDNLFFMLESDKNGKLIATATNGTPIKSTEPLNLVEYIKTDGFWWRVDAIRCVSDSHNPDDDSLVYDMTQVEPCVAKYLEKNLAA